MYTKIAWRIMGIILVLALVISCAAPPASQQPQSRLPRLPQPKPQGHGAPAAAGPTELNAVVITCCSLESQWMLRL